MKGKEGIVDPFNCNALHDRLQSLKSKWEGQAPGFYEWFVEHKLPAVESSMLQSGNQLAWGIHLISSTPTTSRASIE